MALRGKLASELAGRQAGSRRFSSSPMRATRRCIRSIANAALQSRTWPSAMRRLIDQQIREPEEEAKLRAAMPQADRDHRPDLGARARAVRGAIPTRAGPWPRRSGPSPASRRICAANFRWRRSREHAGGGLRGYPDRGLRHRPAADRRRAPLSGRARARDRSQPRKPCLCATQGGRVRRRRTSNSPRPTSSALAIARPDASMSIEASGVLHHLADPMQGWSTLLRLLKPGGFMRLGLYSELARRDIAAAREFVAAGGYDATAGRHPPLPPEPAARRATRACARSSASPDFYSISACRDLLFHVQEHRLTLPQIARISDRAPAVVARIRARARRCWRNTATRSRQTPR